MPSDPGDVSPFEAAVRAARSLEGHPYNFGDGIPWAPDAVPFVDPDKVVIKYAAGGPGGASHDWRPETAAVGPTVPPYTPVDVPLGPLHTVSPYPPIDWRPEVTYDPNLPDGVIAFVYPDDLPDHDHTYTPPLGIDKCAVEGCERPTAHRYCRRHRRLWATEAVIPPGVEHGTHDETDPAPWACELCDNPTYPDRSAVIPELCAPCVQELRHVLRLADEYSRAQLGKPDKPAPAGTNRLTRAGTRRRITPWRATVTTGTCAAIGWAIGAVIGRTLARRRSRT